MVAECTFAFDENTTPSSAIDQSQSRERIVFSRKRAPIVSLYSLNQSYLQSQPARASPATFPFLPIFTMSKNRPSNPNGPNVTGASAPYSSAKQVPVRLPGRNPALSEIAEL